MRWGEDAAGLVFEGGAPTIKFALGENVTRDRQPDRYPATRMGRIQEQGQDQQTDSAGDRLIETTSSFCLASIKKDTGIERAPGIPECLDGFHAFDFFGCVLYLHELLFQLESMNLKLY